MLNQLAAAFERKDYETAVHLLRELQQRSGQDDWVRFYTARLWEATGEAKAAAEAYRQLLQQSTHPKILGQARQGIQRLGEQARSQRQAAIAQQLTEPGQAAPGFLAIGAVVGPPRDQAIQNFGQVMEVDAYTARMLLPNRGWRLYRSGRLAELTVYGQALKQVGVPVMWVGLPEIEQIQIFRVSHFQQIKPQPTVVCRNQQNQLGQIRFDWAEVHQQVNGLLPIFEQVLDLGYRDRPIWKASTQDYAQFCDLHLPKRGCILRLHDSAYAYEKAETVPIDGVGPASCDRTTIRTKWNGLLQQLRQYSPTCSVWSDFTAFGESAADFEGPLRRLKSHIFLSRDTDTYWDAAFHLYSCLIYINSAREG